MVPKYITKYLREGTLVFPRVLVFPETNRPITVLVLLSESLVVKQNHPVELGSVSIKEYFF